VLAIIVLLFSMITVSVGTFYRSAYEKSTKSMILRLREYIENYQRLTGEFPPDGLDYEVTNDEGTLLRGSACLRHYLTQPVLVEVIQGGVPRLKEYPPVAPPFKRSELGLEDEYSPGAREIKDGFGDPIHYDNTQNGEFMEQTGEVHTPPVDDADQPPDPRIEEFTVLGQPAVPKPGTIQSKVFDLWSRGGQGPEYDNDEENQLPIANWNVME